MSIISCNEIGEGRSASSEYSNQKVIVKDVRIFRVQTDSQYHTGAYILANAPSFGPDNLPLDLAVHPDFTDLRVKGRNANMETGEGVAAISWLVTCNYDNQLSDQDEEDSETEPLERRTKFHLESSSFTRVVDRDEEGRPLRNTIGELFDPPLEEEDERSVLVAVKNYDANDLPGLMALVADYRNSVSSDSFLGRPPGSWRMAKVQMSPEQVEDEHRFHSVSWYLELKDEYEFDDPSKIEGSPEPWDRLVLNRGTYAYMTANDPLSYYRLPGNEPKNLKQDGTLITDHGDGADYYYRSYRTKKRRPFSALGLV